jgi:hypothetical protein
VISLLFDFPYGCVSLLNQGWKQFYVFSKMEKPLVRIPIVQGPYQRPINMTEKAWEIQNGTDPM